MTTMEFISLVCTGTTTVQCVDMSTRGNGSAVDSSAGVVIRHFAQHRQGPLQRKHDDEHYDKCALQHGSSIGQARLNFNRIAALMLVPMMSVDDPLVRVH